VRGQTIYPGRARLCAYIEMETAEEKTDTPLFESAGILLNIYANGKGAKRNIPLAKRMACIIWSAPAELEARLEHLSQIEAGKSLETEFDVCDDITSGRMGGECAAHQERISDAERNRYLSQVRGKLSAAQRSFLSDLEKKLDAFVTARSDGEIDQGGTIRMARLIGEEEVVRVQFADGIKTLIDGISGDWKPADYKKADQELNAVYKKLQGRKEFIAEGVSAERIKLSQRAWLKYRDAWVKFGQSLYPDRLPESLITELTRQRVVMLSELAEDEG